MSQSGRRHYVDSLCSFINFAYVFVTIPSLPTRPFEDSTLESAIYDSLVFMREADGYATEVVNVFFACSLTERDGRFRQVDLDSLTPLIAALKLSTKLAVLVKAASENRCNDRNIRQLSAYITSRASTHFFVLGECDDNNGEHSCATDACLVMRQWNESDQRQCDREQADVVGHEQVFDSAGESCVGGQDFEGPKFQAAVVGQCSGRLGVSSKYELHEQALSAMLEDKISTHSGNWRSMRFRHGSETFESCWSICSRSFT